MPCVPSSMYLSGIQSCNHARILSVMCKNVIRSARRVYLSRCKSDNDLLPPLLSSPFLLDSALNADNNRCFNVKLHLCGYSAISLFPQWGETTHQAISFSFLQRQDTYVKRTVLGALKNIHTTMYKECQKENCYQVFLFLHISLFLLFFLILSMCSVMYNFIFFA